LLIISSTKANHISRLNNVEIIVCSSVFELVGYLFSFNLSERDFKGSLHRFVYRNFCVKVHTCISVVRPLIDVNLGLN